MRKEQLIPCNLISALVLVFCRLWWGQGVPVLPLAGIYPSQVARLHGTQLKRDMISSPVHMMRMWQQTRAPGDKNPWEEVKHKAVPPVFHFYSCVFGRWGMKEREKHFSFSWSLFGCLLGGADIQISFNHCECCSITLNHTVEFHESHSVTDV